MDIVGGFDLHRAQMPYDWVDLDTGETARGRMDLRRTVRLRKTLADQRGEWQQRIHAIFPSRQAASVRWAAHPGRP